MKNTLVALMLLGGIMVFSRCDKDDNDNGNEKFQLLTGHTWLADSLLADGVDASGPGMVLENFRGEAEFREDGTGTFGEYSGNWRFQMDQTQIVITTDAHPIPITANIIELTETSFKITTGFPDMVTGGVMAIRMTFIPK